MSSRELKRIWRQAAQRDRHTPVAELRRLARSKRAEQRLLTLVLMRQQLAGGAGSKEYLTLARARIRDSDNTCRWQALIVVGEFIATDPMSVWRVVQRYGRSSDADLRAGVSTVLLEHLLDRYPRRFVSRVRAELRKGNAAFANTVARCWSYGRKDVQRLVEAAAA